MLRDYYDGGSCIAEQQLKSRCLQTSQPLRDADSLERNSSSRSVGMTAHSSTPMPLVLLWILAFTTFSCVAAEDPRGPAIFHQQDTDVGLSIDYPARVPPSPELALLRGKIQERIADFIRSEYEQEEEEPAEPLPVPLAIYASKEDGKRGSYMSLCHFKICNMGRKRNRF